MCRYLRFLAYIVPAYVSYCNDYMFNVILLLLCVFLLKTVSFMLTFVKVPTLRRFLMTVSGKPLNLYTHGNFLFFEIFVLLAVNM